MNKVTIDKVAIENVAINNVIIVNVVIINLAIDNNFKPVSLGERRLRTETAAIMVVGAFNYVNGY